MQGLEQNVFRRMSTVNFGTMRVGLTYLLMLWATAIVAQDFDYMAPERQAARPEQEDAPQKPRSTFRDNLILGGNFGLQFGMVTFLDISPLAGYQVFKNAFLGIGVTYQYLDWQTGGGRFTTHTYGGRVFGRYIIWKGIMVHAEYEMLNLDCFDEDRINLPNPELVLRRRWVPGALVGGGYYQGVGKRSGFTMLILFNALQNHCTPYANPVIRIGFNFGI